MSIEVEIRRTDRKKSVAFEVRLPNTMVVSVPRRLDAGTINTLALDRLAWAAKRLKAIKAGYERHGLPKRFSGGGKFSYLGCDIPLTVIVAPGARCGKVDLTDGRLIATVKPAPEVEQDRLVKTALLKWYSQAALANLQIAVDKWAPAVGAAPHAIRVRNQRRRWGSCSRQGILNFNWRLVMAPPDILEYVVVHELCHLLEPNHSHRYWALVDRAMPDHARYRRWLRDNAILLEVGA